MCVAIPMDVYILPVNFGFRSHYYCLTQLAEINQSTQVSSGIFLW